METIIIDAYNLIHKIAELRVLLEQSQDICVDTMVEKLATHFYGKGIKVIIVFDGEGENRHQKNIDVKFAFTKVGQQFSNADQLIKHFIEMAKNPKLIRVVSNDNEIRSFARECGCRTQSLESFWGDVREKRTKRITEHKETKEKPDHITKGELEFFLKAFNNNKKK